MAEGDLLLLGEFDPITPPVSTPAPVKAAAKSFVLLYTKPWQTAYKIPHRKIWTAADLIRTICSLPRLKSSEKNVFDNLHLELERSDITRDNLQDGTWEIYDSHGNIIRLDDWEELIEAGESYYLLTDTGQQTKDGGSRDSTAPTNDGVIGATQVAATDLVDMAPIKPKLKAPIAVPDMTGILAVKKPTENAQMLQSSENISSSKQDESITSRSAAAAPPTSNVTSKLNPSSQAWTPTSHQFVPQTSAAPFPIMTDNRNTSYGFNNTSWHPASPPAATTNQDFQIPVLKAKVKISAAPDSNSTANIETPIPQEVGRDKMKSPDQIKTASAFDDLDTEWRDVSERPKDIVKKATIRRTAYTPKTEKSPSRETDDPSPAIVKEESQDTFDNLQVTWIEPGHTSSYGKSSNLWLDSPSNTIEASDMGWNLDPSHHESSGPNGNNTQIVEFQPQSQPTQHYTLQPGTSWQAQDNNPRKPEYQGPGWEVPGENVTEESFSNITPIQTELEVHAEDQNQTNGEVVTNGVVEPQTNGNHHEDSDAISQSGQQDKVEPPNDAQSPSSNPWALLSNPSATAALTSSSPSLNGRPPTGPASQSSSPVNGQGSKHSYAASMERFRRSIADHPPPLPASDTNTSKPLKFTIYLDPDMPMPCPWPSPEEAIKCYRSYNSNTNLGRIIDNLQKERDGRINTKKTNGKLPMIKWFRELSVIADDDGSEWLHRGRLCSLRNPTSRTMNDIGFNGTGNRKEYIIMIDNE